eukprot:767973-Hanusia_phi.AAC.2
MSSSAPNSSNVTGDHVVNLLLVFLAVKLDLSPWMPIHRLQEPSDTAIHQGANTLVSNSSLANTSCPQQIPKLLGSVETTLRAGRSSRRSMADRPDSTANLATDLALRRRTKYHSRTLVLEKGDHCCTGSILAHQTRKNQPAVGKRKGEDHARSPRGRHISPASPPGAAMERGSFADAPSPACPRHSHWKPSHWSTIFTGNFSSVAVTGPNDGPGALAHSA